MKKIFAVAVAAASLSCAAFAQEAESSLTFANEVSSDIVTITSAGGNTSAGFAGITEKMSAEYKSEKVDFSVDLRVKLDDDKNAENKTVITFTHDADHWVDGYIEFRPIPILTIFMKDGINTPGAYLPVEDDNISAGNIGSFFGVCLRPIDGLRIAAGLDDSIFGGNVNVNTGADYEIANIGAVGFAVRGINAKLSVGGFFSLTAVENLKVNLGYSWYKNGGEFKAVKGNNLINLGVSYGINALSLGFDFVTNLMPKTDLVQDIYTGLNVGYNITEAFNLGLTAQFQFDVVSNTDNGKAHADIHVKPSASYTVGHNSFSFGVDMNFNDATTIAFPVSWKWSL